MGTKARTPFNYPNMKVRSDKQRAEYLAYALRELAAVVAKFVQALNEATHERNLRLGLGERDVTIADTLAAAGEPLAAFGAQIIEASFDTDGPVSIPAAPYADGGFVGGADTVTLGPAFAPEDWMWSEAEREAADRPVGTLRGEQL